MSRGTACFGFRFGEQALGCRSDACKRASRCIETKKQLLDALDATLGFADYFGGNWDAFWECICDLSWLAPVQVVLIHEDLPMRTDEVSLTKYLSILRDAVAMWNDRSGHELVVVFPEDAEGAIRELLNA